MSSEQGVLDLAKILGTVLVLLALIVMFGPTINQLIRKLLQLKTGDKDESIQKNLREMESNDAAETDGSPPLDHLRFRCPNGHLLKNELSTAGHLTKCPVCASEFAIPKVDTVEQGQAV